MKQVHAVWFKHLQQPLAALTIVEHCSSGCRSQLACVSAVLHLLVVLLVLLLLLLVVVVVVVMHHSCCQSSSVQQVIRRAPWRQAPHDNDAVSELLTSSASNTFCGLCTLLTRFRHTDRLKNFLLTYFLNTSVTINVESHNSDTTRTKHKNTRNCRFPC
jgi:hypothetical protein